MIIVKSGGKYIAMVDTMVNRKLADKLIEIEKDKDFFICTLSTLQNDTERQVLLDCIEEKPSITKDEVI